MPDNSITQPLIAFLLLFFLGYVITGWIESSKTLDENAAMVITISTEAPSAIIETLADFMKIK